MIVLSDQSSLVGGAEAMALLSARGMAEAGLPVTFACGDSGADCPLDRAAIDVVALGGKPLLEMGSLTSGITGFYNRAAHAFVRDIVRRHDTPRTIYHLHNWSQIFSPSIFRALRPVADRLFLSAHDFALVCPTSAYTNYQSADEVCPLVPLSAACLRTNCDRRSYMHKLWRAGRSIQRRLALDFTMARSTIGVIHPDMTEYFTRGGVPPERLSVIRNPVKPYRAERVRAEANRDIFFVGRVVHEKGIDLAAEAARAVGRRLRVIGDGDLRPTLAKQYPEILFEGWRTHEEIGALVAEARALVVPSRLPETFTLVAHEAMRSGIPVVAFSDVDCSEAAALGGAIVVPPREASGLAAAFRRLDDDATVERISHVAFEMGPLFSNTASTWIADLLQNYARLLAGARMG